MTNETQKQTGINLSDCYTLNEDLCLDKIGTFAKNHKKERLFSEGEDENKLVIIRYVPKTSTPVESIYGVVNNRAQIVVFSPREEREITSWIAQKRGTEKADTTGIDESEFDLTYCSDEERREFLNEVAIARGIGRITDSSRKLFELSCEYRYSNQNHLGVYTRDTTESSLAKIWDYKDNQRVVEIRRGSGDETIDDLLRKLS